MTKIFEVSTIVAALVKVREDLYKASGCRGVEVAELNTAQACAILDLVDECTEPGEAGVVGISSEEIRLAAYKVATSEIQIRPSRYGDIHALARTIADNIENGFAAPKRVVDTATIDIAVDTKVLDAAVDRLKSAQAAIDKSVASLDDTLARQFERAKWRREAWNDCKAVMIREATKQRYRRTPTDVLYGFSSAEIRTICDFIDSVQFDESKP